MNRHVWVIPLTVAGRPIRNAGELVRRHLGLTTPVEHWAAPLYDTVPRSDSALRDEDFLAVGALGVRITRVTLSQWAAARPALETALTTLPTDVSLADTDDPLLRHVSDALTCCDLEPTTVAKLLHRSRPRLVPPYDRAISDWYARGLGSRDAGRPPALLHHLRDDLQLRANRESLDHLQHLIATSRDGGLVPSQLRLLDIAVWMAASSEL